MWKIFIILLLKSILVTSLWPLLVKPHHECGTVLGVSCVRAAESSPRSSSADPAVQPAGSADCSAGFSPLLSSADLRRGPAFELLQLPVVHAASV